MTAFHTFDPLFAPRMPSPAAAGVQPRIDGSHVGSVIRALNAIPAREGGS